MQSDTHLLPDTLPTALRGPVYCSWHYSIFLASFAIKFQAFFFLCENDCWDDQWDSTNEYPQHKVSEKVRKAIRGNCIQNYQLCRYIVAYMVGNIVLWHSMSATVKLDFQPYIWWYTSLNDNFEYGYSHSNAQATCFSFKIHWKCSELCLQSVGASSLKTLAS